ncbi:MAG: helix-turn-helix domain-containing protein [Pleurocapsa minor HA4230-MV1]|jgi:hypothetical protein|nr:helix-turn-helix domain-containing protein [Pleurocapsa minor HA4230-MV1]
MSNKKVQGKFYPLQHQEFLKLNQILTQSELSVYLWLKTNDPFGEKFIEADTQKIAEDLEISRRTVQRALVKLQQVSLIELVISKFKYRMKSKLSSDNGCFSEISDESTRNMSKLSDDNKIASATIGSFGRHQDRLDDTGDTSATSVSPSSPETISEQRFQTPKISKTYLDFKDSLSESERENYLKFVKETTKNFRQPIQDIEAWLASQTKAGQNRWEVYYLKYQKENKVRKPNSDSTSVPDSAKQRAIANHQKQLNQEKTDHTKTGNEVEVFTSEFNRLLDSPDNKIKRIDQLKSQSKPTAKTFGRYVSESCEHLRNLRMKSLFAPESIQGGMA